MVSSRGNAAGSLRQLSVGVVKLKPLLHKKGGAISNRSHLLNLRLMVHPTYAVL